MNSRDEIKPATGGAAAEPAAPDASEPQAPQACGNCGRSLDIRDPEKVVCVANLDFRAPESGGRCEHYVRRRKKPEPPQLDAGDKTPEDA